MKTYKSRLIFFSLFAALCMLSSCGGTGGNSPTTDSDKLNIVATTTIVADVVKQVGGDKISTHILLPVGTDPHSFTPSPRDVARISDADLVFANGAGLEVFIEDLLESVSADEKIVYLSDGLDLIMIEGDEDDHQAEDEHGHAEVDPHTWMDPNNVIAWVDKINASLGSLDPDHADVYQSNADTYQGELEGLDTWAQEQVAKIPDSDRMIVTDHTQFSYFARTYGFTQVGAIVPGASSLAEPSAKDLAALEDTVNQMGVKAIFVGNTVNPTLAARVAEDTGTQLVTLFTGSLSDPNGDAGTYVAYLQYNVNAIVGALQQP